jgi:hypothetical protein
MRAAMPSPSRLNNRLQVRAVRCKAKLSLRKRRVGNQDRRVALSPQTRNGGHAFSCFLGNCVQHLLHGVAPAGAEIEGPTRSPSKRGY